MAKHYSYEPTTRFFLCFSLVRRRRFISTLPDFNDYGFVASSKHLRHNPTLHQTPVTWAVPAGACGGAGELNVVPSQ